MSATDPDAGDPPDPLPSGPLTARPRNGNRVPLVIGDHATGRQGERLVSVDDIIAAIEFPTRTGLKTQPGRKRVARTERGREVHVVYEEWDDGTVYVVTTFRYP